MELNRMKKKGGFYIKFDLVLVHKLFVERNTISRIRSLIEKMF